MDTVSHRGVERTMKSSFIITAVLLLVGCGDTKNTYTAEPLEEPLEPQKNTEIKGDAIIINSGSDTSLSTVTVTENGVYVDCGSAGCGDVSIGVKQDDNETQRVNK